MKRRLHIFIVLLFLGFQFSHAQDENLVDPKNTIKISSKKIVENSKSYDLKSKVLNNKSKIIPIDDLDCLRDPKTGDCIDDIDIGGNSSTADAGYTKGNFEVSLTGSATYSIPFNLPSGIKSVSPSIGLNFSSQGSNGLAGWGWNISGLSTISRVPTTKYHDNKSDGVDFKDDRFSIDGQRLILKSGIYGASGSIYETENYSNIKVVAYGSSPYGSTYGPQYFIVFYPNGTRAWYGNGGNSRNRLEWAIYKWQDPQGNYVQYTYHHDNGLLSINNIKYGGRSGGTSSMNEIKFTYISRTRPEQIYTGNYSFKRTNLLKKIEIKSNGSVYRNYELFHTNSSLNYQRLISVKESNAQNKFFDPIKFNYGTSSSGLGFAGELNHNLSSSGDYKHSRLVPGEFNGDGNLDFISYNSSQKNKLFIYQNLFENGNSSVRYEVNTGAFDDVFPNTTLSWNNKVLHEQGITIATETINQNNSSSSVRFRTFAMAAYGAIFQYDKTWTTNSYLTDNYCNNSTRRKIPKQYISGDFNGDGLTDVLAISKSYSKRSCYNSPCDNGDDIRFQKKQIKNEQTKDTKSIARRPPDFDCCDCETYTVNSSKVDFINLDRSKTSNFSNHAGYLMSSIKYNDLIRTGDYNGDGILDIFHFTNKKVYIYTLKNNLLFHLKTISDEKINTNYSILLGDYNGDGKTDFALPNSDNTKIWKFFISKGEDVQIYTKDIGVYYRKTYVSPGKTLINGWLVINPMYIHKYRVQDFNRDGKSDIIHHYVLTPYSSSTVYKQYNTGLPPNKGYIHGHENINIFSDKVTFTHSIQHSVGAENAGKNDIPIFVETGNNNAGLEYAYIHGKKIRAYEFLRDNQKEVTLKSISNNGITTTIEYDRLGFSSNNYNKTYTSDLNENYPYVNINYAQSYNLVKKIKEIGGGITRSKQFKYEGAVSNVFLGFQGFKTIKRTNWDGDGVSTIWNVSNHNPQLRGAIKQEWASTSSSSFPSNFISKTNYTYRTELNSRKIFLNQAIKVIKHNNIQNSIITKDFTFDTYNNPLKISTSFNGGSKTQTFLYNNNPTSLSESYHIGRTLKKTELSTIGSNSFTTEEQYTYNNNLIIQHKSRGNGGAFVTESFSYDSFGNVTQKSLSASGVSTRTEKFKYDSSGRFLIESSDIEGLKTSFTYDSNTGNTLTTKSPFGLKTRFNYDGWGRLIRETDYLGKQTNLSYKPIVGGGMEQKTDYSQGNDKIIIYNTFGWVLESRVLGLNNKWTKIKTEYDILGRKIRQSEPYFNFPSKWNTIAYDGYGREIARTSFNGLVANITYNGLVSAVDDGTKTIKTTKDGGGNIVKVEDPGGVVNYTYFGNGTMKNANYGSHIVKTEIDGWGRKTKLTDSSAGIYTYRYNSLGEILEETTPKGTTLYTYDGFGKIVTKKVSGEETNLNLNYIYNSTTKLLASIQGKNGRTNENYTYTYLYDGYKRPYITRESNGKAFFEHQVGRDSYGRVSNEIYITTNHSDNVNSTVRVKNIYDTSSGTLTEIKDANNNASLWKVNEVNERGQTIKTTLGNNITKNRTYDSYGFLTKIYDRASSVVLDVDYSFNTVRGNLNSRKNNSLGWNENFTYDHLDRLTNISGSVSKKQQYDGRGRITANSEIGSYNYEPNNVYRLKEVNLNTKGDLYYQNQPIQKIRYNAYKKPISISVKDRAKVDFEYGILQNRSHAYFGGNEDNKLNRRYQKHYSGITPVEIEVDKQGNTKIITYIGGDAYSAPIVHIKQTASGSANGYHYLHRDYLGSILAITNSVANILEQRQFGAWGVVDKFKRGNSEIDFEYSTTLLNRGYTGHEHFADVGLIHMNGRMYDAKLGRFLSPDNYIQAPFSTQSFNRYGYVLNNPLKYNDPSGELFSVVFAYLVANFTSYAIIGAVIGGVSYITGAIVSGNWSWGGFASSIVGGVVGVTLAGVGGLSNTQLVLSAIAAPLLPSFNVPIGDFSINVSPTILFGKSLGIGASISASYKDGNFSFSAGIGVVSYGNYQGFGNQGAQIRHSLMATFDDGKTGFSLGSNFWSGDGSMKEFKQVTGIGKFRSGDFNFTYENDGNPFGKKGRALNLADGNDSYRTAAVTIGIGKFKAGFNLFTGKRTNFEGDKDKVGNMEYGDFGERMPNGYVNEDGHPYRLGAAYFSYGNYRVGIDSDRHVRHPIQDMFAHNIKLFGKNLTQQPGFKSLTNSISPYFQYHTTNPFTSW